MSEQPPGFFSLAAKWKLQEEPDATGIVYSNHFQRVAQHLEGDCCSQFLNQHKLPPSGLLCVQPNHPVLVLKLGDSREAKQHRAGFLISLFAIKSIKKNKMAKKWLLEVIKKQRKGRDLS